MKEMYKLAFLLVIPFYAISVIDKSYIFIILLVLIAQIAINTLTDSKKYDIVTQSLLFKLD